MSSITYHYGGKQGLYLAAARHIADQMGERMAPALAASEARSRDGEGPDAALAALLAIIDRFVEMMVHPRAPPGPASSCASRWSRPRRSTSCMAA